MADISDVNASVIKDLYQRLESLSCMPLPSRLTSGTANTRSSSDHDEGSILKTRGRQNQSQLLYTLL